MHPLARALLGAWELRLDVLAVIIPLGVFYTVGWRRLRRQSSYRKFANGWRLSAYWGGLFLIALALMSPIDQLGSQLFFMHMIQHMITIMYAAPLLLLANPFPFMLWALPDALRRHMGLLFTRNTLLRRSLAKLTWPPVAWFAYLIIFVGWHDAAAYNAALYYDWVHNIQHLTFFGAALLYWYPVIAPAPRLGRRLPAWGKLAYLIGSVPPNMMLGVSIAFAEEVIYTYYLSVPRFLGFSALQDQQLSGAIMWIQGSEMYIVVTLFILARLFYRKGEANPPHTAWDSDTAMIAPGLEGRARQNQYNKVMAYRAAQVADASAKGMPASLAVDRPVDGR